jgi:cysteine desulfurase
LRDDFWTRIAKFFPDAQQNGDPVHRLANTLNTSFIGVDSETMLMALDLEGICASSGSACMVGSVRASHVLDDRGRNRQCSRRTRANREANQRRPRICPRLGNSSSRSVL